MKWKRLEMNKENDGFDTLRKMYLNEKVIINPKNLMTKEGIVIDINPAGVVVKITYSEDPAYKIDTNLFICFSDLSMVTK
mgnify:FL=1